MIFNALLVLQIASEGYASNEAVNVHTVNLPYKKSNYPMPWHGINFRV